MSFWGRFWSRRGNGQQVEEQGNGQLVVENELATGDGSAELTTGLAGDVLPDNGALPPAGGEVPLIASEQVEAQPVDGGVFGEEKVEEKNEVEPSASPIASIDLATVEQVAEPPAIESNIEDKIEAVEDDEDDRCFNDLDELRDPIVSELVMALMEEARRRSDAAAAAYEAMTRTVAETAKQARRSARVAWGLSSGLAAAMMIGATWGTYSVVKSATENEGLREQVSTASAVSQERDQLRDQVTDLRISQARNDAERKALELGKAKIEAELKAATEARARVEEELKTVRQARAKEQPGNATPAQTSRADVNTGDQWARLLEGR